MEGTSATFPNFTGDLIPHLVDKRAALTPDTIYSEYPVSTLTYDEGYRKITYRDFANAVNGAAAWLVDTLGPSKDFETLAYMGPNDIRYPALILGAVKAGYKVWPAINHGVNYAAHADRKVVPHISSQQLSCSFRSL